MARLERRSTGILAASISRHKLEGADVDGALELIATTRRRLEKLGQRVRVVSVYEAGYDGFWLHRRLTEAGIDSRVIVFPSSGA